MNGPQGVTLPWSPGARVLQLPVFCVFLPSLKLDFFFSVVEDDEDDFPNTRTDGEFLHNNNGSKEKCE